MKPCPINLEVALLVLKELGELDEAKGIIIAQVGPNLYIVSLEPGKAITAHYHEKDSEWYWCLEGTGRMHIGPVENSYYDWARAAPPFTPGEMVEILENQVHQLENTGGEALVFVLECPESHLSPDADWRRVDDCPYLEIDE